MPNIELKFLSVSDYDRLKEAMIEAYPAMPHAYWKERHVELLTRAFPEGQVIITIDGELAGGALSIIVDYARFEPGHTYREITGDFTFSTHDPEGDILYGIDIFIRPKFRGLRLGRRLYDYRKELCERLNLRGIVFGGRIPNYHTYADGMSPREYIRKVRTREIHDPVLDFQLSNDFHPAKVIKGYLPGDAESSEYAVLLEWKNIYYEKPRKKAAVIKKSVRLGLIQWQMRPYRDPGELMQQAEFFVDAVSGYRSDFALFPEFFNAPLMAENNHLEESQAIRELARHTAGLVEDLSRLAIAYNINIITGSMPEMVDGRLYNAGYLCKRQGSVERFEKIHVTPDEARVWGLQGGGEFPRFRHRLREDRGPDLL